MSVFTRLGGLFSRAPVLSLEAELEAQLELADYQSEVIESLHQALNVLRKKADSERRSSVQALGAVLLSVGGAVLVSKDMTDAVFGFEGEINIDVNRAEDGGLAFGVRLTEAEKVSEEV